MEQEVLINCEYGGYCLSYPVVQKVADIKGDKIYWYAHIDNNENVKPSDNNKYTYKRIPYKDAHKYSSIKLTATTKDYGESMHVIAIDHRYKYDLFNLNVMHQVDKRYRTDKAIIEAVKSLGLQKSSGSYCTLKIVRIPKHCYFTIVSYLGEESLVYTENDKMHKIS